MEDHRRKNCSGDKFSFPDVSDTEFEFGSVTPGSPRSPADHLFSNGKLLPHSFPIHPRNSTSYSRSMSRTSSISSKESFLSSRSNSTNSSSSCSSARTSISNETSSSKTSSQLNQGKIPPSKVRVTKERRKQGENKPVLTSQQNGPSQRWQFIAPMPALNYQTSMRRRKGGKKRGIQIKNKRKRKGFFKKLFMSFVSTCRQCHAMNPTRKENVLEENFHYIQ